MLEAANGERNKQFSARGLQAGLGKRGALERIPRRARIFQKQARRERETLVDGEVKEKITVRIELESRHTFKST